MSYRVDRRWEGTVILVAALIYGGCMVSPPSLMDDVDAVQAQIARNMLESGDWVTARLNGVAYLEKAPLKYWMIAVSYMLFGVSDVAARLPLVLSTIALCWLAARMGEWAFSPRAGLYAGLALATCAGLFLFTRILIPDAVLTLTVALSLWAFLRALEEDSRLWAYLFWACMGAGFLLKGLVAMVFPLGAVFLYLLARRQLTDWPQWKRLRPFSGLVITLAIASPWVALATLRNPPYLDFTMRSAAGEYHGFFWFFFLNEHLFRFLNMRHPRDYNTVPRLYFWLFHLLWLFPWSAYFPAVVKETLAAEDRAARLRLLALCWSGFILAFFTLSTTQEYYSMPCYPPLALLLGSALDRESRWLSWGSRTLSIVCALAAAVLAGIWWMVRGLPAAGDIARALTLNPEAYTLSLGHMHDLTLPAFAFLRAPLVLAAIAMAVGALGAWRWRGGRTVAALVAMMVLFTHAARLAMVTFDPYLSSRRLAEALRDAPHGEVVFDNQYYTFSSVFFYTGARGWLLNGRVNNLEYGSYAPGAADVFLDDAEFAQRWKTARLHYLLVEGPSKPRVEKLVGRDAMHLVAESGGKFLFANQPASFRRDSP